MAQGGGEDQYRQHLDNFPDHLKFTDFTKRNGTGGESIYGGTFADEDLTMPVDKEGCVMSLQFRFLGLTILCDIGYWLWRIVDRIPMARSFSSPLHLHRT